MMGVRLNGAQEAAASALRGRVLISAGAGSGKTATLAERFARALRGDDAQGWKAADVSQVVTITFTGKAAAELAERIRLTLRAEGRFEDARSVDGAWISTIHALCSRLLRRHALEAGLDPGFSVLESLDTDLLAARAFETAAREVLESPAGSALFAAYGFDEIRTAVESVGNRLATYGLDASRISIPAVRSGEEIRAEASEFFALAARRVQACGADQKSAVALEDRCRMLAHRIESFDVDGLGGHDVARLVWSELATWRKGYSCRAIEEVHADVAATAPRIRAEAAEAAVQPIARALVDLVARRQAEFESLKARRGALDFNDLQIQTLRLFESNPDILARCRAAFRMVMVDEFQDTDGLQLALVESLAGEDLCTVGDENQSIYRFRGADVDLYRRHREDMGRAGARTFELAENYRSHDEILSFVNGLFGDDLLFGSSLLRLRHGRIEPDPPRVPAGARVSIAVGEGSRLAAEEHREAASALARRLATFRDEHGFSGAEMALLIPAYRHADEYATALREEGFLALIAGGDGLFATPEAAMVRALAAVIANPYDEEALLPLLAGGFGRLSDAVLWRLAGRSGTGIGLSLWERLVDATEIMGEDGADAEAVAAVIESARSRVGVLPLAEVMERALDERAVDLLLLARGAEGRQALANVRKVLRMARAFERDGLEGPAAFVAHIDARERSGERIAAATLVDDDSPAVRIMSVHAAKGLEFPIVAVTTVGWEGSGRGSIVRTREARGSLELTLRLPKEGAQADSGADKPSSFIALEKAQREDESAESKRLFYVACTRAQEALVIAGSLKAAGQPDPGSSRPLEWIRAVQPGLTTTLQEQECGEVSVGGTPVLVSGGPSSASDVQAASVAEPPRSVERRPTDSRPQAGAPPHESPRTEHATDVRVERISYSDLSLFRRCGLRFFAERVLRLGGDASRADASELGMGSALHAVLQVSNAGTMPPNERVEAIGRRFRLDPAALQSVRRAAMSFLESRLSHELESHDVVRREWSFSVRLAVLGAPVYLSGSIDAYGRTEDSGLVVDYKSGDSGGEDELRERYELQAKCYALAVLEDGCTKADVVFSRPQVAGPDGEPQEIRYSFTAADRADLEAEIVAIHAAMEAGSLTPRETWDRYACRECAAAYSICSRRERS